MKNYYRIIKTIVKLILLYHDTKVTVIVSGAQITDQF
jgi:hypothetical protein